MSQGLIKFSDGAHWYECGKGEYKPKHDADLRVARKEFLYPSVTSILKDEFVNIWLQRWKMNELAMAANDNPKQAHEDDEAYCQRIYDISLEKALIAAEFGKKVHDAIEHYPQMPLFPEVLPFFDKFAPWFDTHVREVAGREKILVDHDLGVAGRTDMIAMIDGVITVEDTKTQGIKPDSKGRYKPKFYDDWVRQLAFYSVAYAKESGTFPSIPPCVSVVINSITPMEPFVKVWSKEEVLFGYKEFVCAAWHWFASRGYWPQPKGPFDVTSTIPMPI
jgi:hypothetical protein